MPWRTVNGVPIEWPLALHAKVAKSNHPDREAVLEALHKLRRVFDEASRLDQQVIQLRYENMRLQHENEFMLKLIDRKENDL